MSANDLMVMLKGCQAVLTQPFIRISFKSVILQDISFKERNIKFSLLFIENNSSFEDFLKNYYTAIRRTLQFIEYAIRRTPSQLFAVHSAIF